MTSILSIFGGAFLLLFTIGISWAIGTDKNARVKRILLLIPIVVSIVLIVMGVAFFVKQESSTIELENGIGMIQFYSAPNKKEIDDNTVLYEDLQKDIKFHAIVKQYNDSISLEELSVLVVNRIEEREGEILDIEKKGNSMYLLIEKRFPEYDLLTMKKLYLFERLYVELSMDSLDIDILKEHNAFLEIRNL